jgi:hypothetical protein
MWWVDKNCCSLIVRTIVCSIDLVDSCHELCMVREQGRVDYIRVITRSNIDAYYSCIDKSFETIDLSIDFAINTEQNDGKATFDDIVNNSCVDAWTIIDKQSCEPFHSVVWALVEQYSTMFYVSSRRTTNNWQRQAFIQSAMFMFHVEQIFDLSFTIDTSHEVNSEC